MPIFKKSHLEEPLEALDRYYQGLRQMLEGVSPSKNLAPIYGFEDRDYFTDQYTDIDLSRLNRAIGHFKVEVESLKGIKSQAFKSN